MIELFKNLLFRVIDNKKTTYLGLALFVCGLIFTSIGKATFTEWALSWPCVIALLIVKDDVLIKKP